MQRFIIAFLLCWLCAEATAQGTAVERSSDVVVIRGKSYYLHTVEAGQTLYSICKAYGADVEEVKALNEKADNALSLYEVLKIPFVEQQAEAKAQEAEKPFVQRDGKYYYHRVEKGETIYSIARRYGMRPRRLLKHNPDYSTNQPLAIGAVVRLPLEEIDPALLVEVKAAEVKVEGGSEEKQAEEVTAEVPTITKDTLAVQEEVMTAQEVAAEGDSTVRVALLLPLLAKEVAPYQDSLPDFQQVKITPRTEQFVAFYEGMLLAADSLKRKGYRVSLHVYDTERSTQKTHAVAAEVNRLHPDLVIGPVYAQTYKTLMDNLQDKSIPVVYPLSSQGEGLGAYANAVQVNPSFEVVVGEMVRWLAMRSADANLVNIRTGHEGASDAERRILQDSLAKLQGMRIFMWGMERSPLDTLRTMLVPDRENIIILPTDKEADVSNVLPMLSALADDYPISVLGLPDWQRFTSVDHETYFKLNTRVFTYHHTDYTSAAGKRLTEEYRKYFYSEPLGMAFRAFDLGLYFMELAAAHKGQVPEVLPAGGAETGCSMFRFATAPRGRNAENHAFYIIQYTSDFEVKVEKWQ